MIVRAQMKNPTALMSVGMALLAVGIVSLRYVHPSTMPLARIVPMVTGLIYGAAIGCLLLSIWARRGRRCEQGAERP